MNVLGELIACFSIGTLLGLSALGILLYLNKLKVEAPWYIYVSLIVILIISIIFLAMAIPREFYVFRLDGTFHPN